MLTQLCIGLIIYGVADSFTETNAIIKYNNVIKDKDNLFYKIPKNDVNSQFYISEEVLNNDFTKGDGYYAVTYRGFTIPQINIYPIILNAKKVKSKSKSYFLF